jgi:hypothetical protein
MKSKGGEPYRLQRRTRKKGGSGELSGYALDLTIRVNSEGAYFLQDHNSRRNVMPHSDREDLVETLVEQLERNHQEHFGSS